MQQPDPDFLIMLGSFMTFFLQTRHLWVLAFPSLIPELFSFLPRLDPCTLYPCQTGFMRPKPRCSRHYLHIDSSFTPDPTAFQTPRAVHLPFVSPISFNTPRLLKETRREAPYLFNIRTFTFSHLIALGPAFRAGDGAQQPYCRFFSQKLEID